MSSKSVNTTELAKRYASALFRCACEKGAEEDILRELREMRDLMAQSAELDMLMNSQAVSEKDRLAGVAAVSEKAGFSALMSDFLGVMAENSRLSVFEKVVTAFEAAYEEHRGILPVSVVSARPLDEGAALRLTDVLGKFFDKKIRLDASVDPSLIGGLTVQVGSRMADASVRSKLQRLDLIMKGVGL